MYERAKKLLLAYACKRIENASINVLRGVAALVMKSSKLSDNVLRVGMAEHASISAVIRDRKFWIV